MTEKKTLCFKALKCAVKANGMIIGNNMKRRIATLTLIAFVCMMSASCANKADDTTVSGNSISSADPAVASDSATAASSTTTILVDDVIPSDYRIVEDIPDGEYMGRAYQNQLFLNSGGKRYLVVGEYRGEYDSECEYDKMGTYSTLYFRTLFTDDDLKKMKAGDEFIYDHDNNRTTITHDDENHPLGRIYGITKDSKDNYWVCSKDHGLFKMTAKAGGGWSLKRYYHSDDDQWSMSANSAYIAIEDKEGNIWVATYGGGVNILTKRDGKEVFLNGNNEMRKYPHKSHLKIRTLALDKYGNIWAGSTDGILIMSYKNRQLSIEPLESPDDPEHALMCNDVVCLARDKEGNMWVGTMGGGIGRTIGQDKQGRWLFDTFDASSGLPSEEIRSIIFDIHGNAWFGTDHIICSFDTKKNIFTTFSSLDGVDETMLSEGESAAITMGSDKILFGTLDGYYVVDRKKLMTSTGSLLKLRITDFMINGEIQSPRLNDNYEEYPAESKSITLPSHNSVFSFRFAALNYQLQHRVHYQYMLEGYDKDWQNAGKDRMATYSDVPSGTYKFKVKAFLLESPDKYDMRSVEVIVPTYFIFSRTVMWIILCVLFFGGTYLVTRMRDKIYKKLRQVFSSKKKKEKEEEEEMTDDYEIINPSDLI